MCITWEDSNLCGGMLLTYMIYKTKEAANNSPVTKIIFISTVLMNINTGRDTYCEFYRKPLPQMSKISDMGVDGREIYRPHANGWMENG